MKNSETSQAGSFVANEKLWNITKGFVANEKLWNITGGFVANEKL